jgi:uncharacterized protein YjiS (DUF1127 family)
MKELTMTTTTCLAHPTGLPGATNLIRIRMVARAWHQQWQHTRVLSTMADIMLQDIGAPHWLRQRAQARQNMDSYEYVKAMARLRY